MLVNIVFVNFLKFLLRYLGSTLYLNCAIGCNDSMSEAVVDVPENEMAIEVATPFESTMSLLAERGVKSRLNWANGLKLPMWVNLSKLLLLAFVVSDVSIVFLSWIPDQ